MDRKSFVVLLAEDSSDDIIATKRAWRRHGIANPLHVVRDGEECLDYLYRRGAYGEGRTPAPRAGLLLLDINMPKMDGLTVLRQVRDDGAHSHLPIVVLTTSNSEDDCTRSYDLGANAYVVKPVGFDNFAEVLRVINEFWETAELPT